MEYELRWCGSFPAIAVVGPQNIAMKATPYPQFVCPPPMMQMHTNFHGLIFVETYTSAPTG